MLRHHEATNGDTTPYELAKLACPEAGSKFQGSATLVALGLADHETVDAMNLGDSGYALFRPQRDTNSLEMYHRSKSQQKMFNFPFQCGSQGDPASDAEKFQHKFSDGDIFVVFSDGFHDNVHDEAMLQILEANLDFDSGLLVNLGAAADELSRLAYFLGKDQTYRSPWMQELEETVKSGGQLPPQMGNLTPNMLYVGGKHDDITVTVAQVFVEKEGQERVNTQQRDTYFKEDKHIYVLDEPIKPVRDTMPRSEEL